MADITVTAAEVLEVGTTQRLSGKAGETITPGDFVYLGAGGKIFVADNTTDAKATVAGLALNGGALDQPITYATAGTVDLGATLVVGEIYVISAAGTMSPAGDLATGDWVTLVGIAKTADNLQLMINAAGVQVPA